MPRFTLKELFSLVTLVAFIIGLMGALFLALNGLQNAWVAAGLILLGLASSIAMTLFLVVTAFNRGRLD